MRRLLKRSFPIICAYYLIDNLKISRCYQLGEIETASGMSHARCNPSDSIAYIEEVFNDYKRYSGINRFYGRIAEIGPGDNCGVGMLFLNDGCESVDLIDRFYSKRNPGQQAEIYRKLLASYPALNARLGHYDVYDESTFAGINRYYGANASAEEFFLTHSSYDFIISRAVLEHVYDPVLALRGMTAALNPGGMLLHKVDLRDHGMFSEYFHELKFLEVPDYLYKRMTRASGRPNRVLINQYRAALYEVNLDFSLLVTRLAKVDDITPHKLYEKIPQNLREKSLAYVKSMRHRFANSLKDVSADDLSITGFFLVAKKAEIMRSH